MVDKSLLDEKKQQLESKPDYTVKELSQFLNIPRVTVQSWLNRGLFPNAHKRGNQWVIPTVDILNFQPSRAGRKPPFLDLDGYPPILIYYSQSNGYNAERNHLVYLDVEKVKSSELDWQTVFKKWNYDNQTILERIWRDEKRRLEK